MFSDDVLNREMLEVHWRPYRRAVSFSLESDPSVSVAKRIRGFMRLLLIMQFGPLPGWAKYFEAAV